MEFKQLELEPEGSWLSRLLKSAHLKKTIISIIIGAVAGFAYFYFTEGKDMAQMASAEIIKSTLIGGFFGFFISNSPCARNKC